MNKTMRVMLLAGATAVLAACGGGDDDNSPPPDPTAAVPASASESVAGLVSYLEALTASDADQKDPVKLTGFRPKESDDTEPEPLD